MAKKLRVWGMGTYENGFHERAVVATATKAEAVKALDVTRYYFDRYVAETGNKFEVKVALENPGIRVLIAGR